MSRPTTLPEKIATVSLCAMEKPAREIAAMFDVSEDTVHRILSDTKKETNDHSLHGLLASPYLRYPPSAPRRVENRGGLISPLNLRVVRRGRCRILRRSLLSEASVGSMDFALEAF